MTRRCYSCDQAEAMYEAHLDHDATPVVLLCEACAIWERDAGSVVWIHTRDRNADSNRGRGHQRTTKDKGARDLVLPHWSPLVSTAAQDYGSEGWGFESLRARHADQRKRCGC